MVNHRLKSAGLMFSVVAITAIMIPRAQAMIMGGSGNSPMTNASWPKGADAVFNVPARVAWWEGPPFGGGQWMAECRGDAKALNSVLVNFAKLDAKSKRIVVHDGVGHSFWLNMNREPAKEANARIDWSVMFWSSSSWEHLSKLPVGLNPTSPRDAKIGPPSQIDVYTGGTLKWADLVVPAEIEVVDQRLEAHGFSSTDGVVLEGKVVDLATKQPLAAKMRLQRIEPQTKGGYLYPTVAETVADAQGRWVLTKTPTGWFRVVIEADGFVSRVVGYAQFDNQPGWHPYDGGLSHPSTASGKVNDDKGQPIAGVDVSFQDVEVVGNGLYESPNETRVQTDAKGLFHFDQLPIGRATVWVHKIGYTRPGLGQPITMPAKPVEIGMAESPTFVMVKSAKIQITVDFAGTTRPAGYLVKVEPEGGPAVGKWSASGDIDAKNQITYEHIPPGRYLVQGQPNPSTGGQKGKAMMVELKGGETTELKLLAK